MADAALGRAAGEAARRDRGGAARRRTARSRTARNRTARGRTARSRTARSRAERRRRREPSDARPDRAVTAPTGCRHRSSWRRDRRRARARARRAAARRPRRCKIARPRFRRRSISARRRAAGKSGQAPGASGAAAQAAQQRRRRRARRWICYSACSVDITGRAPPDVRVSDPAPGAAAPGRDNDRARTA